MLNTFLRKLAYFANQGDRSLDFIVTGFPKCGTTSLHDLFWKYTNCQIPYLKELHLLNTLGVDSTTLKRELFPFDSTIQNIISTRNTKYFSNFRGKELFCKGKLGEITPSYVYRIERVYENIKNLQPTLPTQLIFIRDPAEAAISHYKMQVRNGLIPFDFGNWISIEQKLFLSGNYRVSNLNGFRYERFIPKALGLFPDTRIVFSEHFFSTQELVFNKILSAIGIDQVSNITPINANNSENSNREKDTRVQDLEDSAGRHRSWLQEFFAPTYDYISQIKNDDNGSIIT